MGRSKYVEDCNGGIGGRYFWGYVGWFFVIDTHFVDFGTFEMGEVMGVK